MIDVKAVELTIGGEVDASLFLDVEDNAGGIKAGLFTGECSKPFWNGIRPDGSS
jgi:hypothetical protein